MMRQILGRQEGDFGYHQHVSRACFCLCGSSISSLSISQHHGVAHSSLCAPGLERANFGSRPGQRQGIQFSVPCPARARCEVVIARCMAYSTDDQRLLGGQSACRYRVPQFSVGHGTEKHSSKELMLLVEAHRN